jgi:hypothetical protein
VRRRCRKRLIRRACSRLYLDQIRPHGLVPGLLIMLETSMNFSVPYTMNTADINIRLMKITMSDIFASPVAAADQSTAYCIYSAAGRPASQYCTSKIN